MTFQRARTDEQREARRRVILETAAAMLDEMPVAEISLRELSRRVGLAKSNVLRYFESREAVLLELLDYFMGEWLAELSGQLDAAIEPGAPAVARARRLAEVLSASLAGRAVLCDLFGAQGGVLERNVSLEVITRHKRASLGRLRTMSGLVRRHVPELGDTAELFCLQTMVIAGAVAAYVPPPPPVLAAYEAEPALGVLDYDLGKALRLTVTMSMLGALPRP